MNRFIFSFALFHVYTLLICLVSGLVPAELNKRIYGGYELPECQAPFEVSVATIRGDVASTCGGTLISPTHVVTAAHCLVPYDKPYPVKVGYNSQIKTEQTVVRATKVTIHPSYLANPDDGRYDIAILEIPQIKFNKYTQRIPIYNSKISVGQKLLAVGWGGTGNPSISQDALRATTVIVGGYKTCQSFKSNFKANDDSRVCALGNLTPGDGICMGDSGSSVSVEQNGLQFYVGIGSRINFLNGAGCGGKDSASFFVQVAYFLDYIVQATGLSREYLLGRSSNPVAPSEPAYSTIPMTTAGPAYSTTLAPTANTLYSTRSANIADPLYLTQPAATANSLYSTRPTSAAGPLCSTTPTPTADPVHSTMSTGISNPTSIMYSAPTLAPDSTNTDLVTVTVTAYLILTAPP